MAILSLWLRPEEELLLLVLPELWLPLVPLVLMVLSPLLPLVVGLLPAVVDDGLTAAVGLTTGEVVAWTGEVVEAAGGFVATPATCDTITVVVLVG